jgi:formylmethanofuran dehydrogenase subunit E
LAPHCKKCANKMEVGRIRDRDKLSESWRRYYQKTKDRDSEKKRRRAIENQARAPKTEKYYARQSLATAVKSGKVVKPMSCSECPETHRIHGHHEDYSKPLDVEWLCPRCHGKRHRKHRDAG